VRKVRLRNWKYEGPEVEMVDKKGDGEMHEGEDRADAIKHPFATGRFYGTVKKDTDVTVPISSVNPDVMRDAGREPEAVTGRNEGRRDDAAAAATPPRAKEKTKAVRNSAELTSFETEVLKARARARAAEGAAASHETQNGKVEIKMPETQRINENAAAEITVQDTLVSDQTGMNNASRTSVRKTKRYNIGPTIGLAGVITIIILLIAFLVSKPAGEVRLQPGDTTAAGTQNPVVQQQEETGNPEVLNEESTANEVTAGSADGGMTGLWQDNVYINEFIGIKYTLTEGWERMGDDVLNSPSTIPDGGKLDAALIVNNETGENILIRLFDLDVTVDGASIYETEFLKGMKEAGERDTAANAAFGDIFMTQVGGEQYWGIRESIAEVATVYYLAHRVGSYMTIVTIKTEGSLDGVLENFS
jgi:hypothetical protein